MGSGASRGNSDANQLQLLQHQSDTTFIGKFVNKYHDEFTDVLRFLLYDDQTRLEFCTFLRKHYSAQNIDFFEAVEELRLLNHEPRASDENFQAELAPILSFVENQSFCCSQSLKVGVKNVSHSRENVLQVLTNIQHGILKSVDSIVVKFERSKEFAQCFHYESVKAMPSDKSVVVTTRSSTLSAHVRNQFSRSLSLAHMTQICIYREILLVENVSIIAKILICWMKQSNQHFNVYHACNEIEAIQQISTRHFDIVLFNLDMNQHGGFEVLNNNNQYDSKFSPDKFIGMTFEKLDSKRVQKAIDHGVFHKQHILRKPFSMHELLPLLLGNIVIA